MHTNHACTSAQRICELVTGKGLSLFPAQSTAKVNCRLHSQYLHTKGTVSCDTLEVTFT